MVIFSFEEPCYLNTWWSATDFPWISSHVLPIIRLWTSSCTALYYYYSCSPDKAYIHIGVSVPWLWDLRALYYLIWNVDGTSILSSTSQSSIKYRISPLSMLLSQYPFWNIQTISAISPLFHSHVASSPVANCCIVFGLFSEHITLTSLSKASPLRDLTD